MSLICQSPFTGAFFSFCSIPSASLASLRPVSGTRTQGAGSRHRRISESLLALALVEPTQYVTHDVNIPDTCPAM